MARVHTIALRSVKVRSGLATLVMVTFATIVVARRSLRSIVWYEDPITGFDILVGVVGRFFILVVIVTVLTLQLETSEIIGWDGMSVGLDKRRRLPT